MVTSRPYSSPSDLDKIIQFLVDMRSRNPTQRWHPGDLVWRMHYSHLFDRAANVQLWEDERGEVVGFGWRYPPDGADLNPRDADLLPDMIAWAQSGAPGGDIYTATQDVDTAENAVLEALGFKPTPAYGYHLRRKLDDQPPEGKLPEGFALRSLAGDHEAPERAALHRTAFQSDAVTDEGYRNVMHAPLYDRDLDLVITAPDGRLAAFCLCWLDTTNKVGLFEPVATHPDFQRQGLARTVMLEGMRRMKARGMEVAIIASAAENVASLGLYTSLGFRVESKERVLRQDRQEALPTSATSTSATSDPNSPEKQTDETNVAAPSINQTIKRSAQLSGTLRTLLCATIIALPLLMLFGVLWAQGLSLANYVPLFSDEVYYWRQALTFRNAGFVGGYYTYAEQPARFGHYYSWGLFVPLLQAILTLPFQWSFDTIPLLNAGLLCAALALFIRLTKPTLEHLLWLLAALITFYPLLLYQATSMIEVSQYACAVAVAAACWVFMTSSTPRRKLIVTAILVLMAASLMRPAIGLLFIPLLMLSQRYRTPRRIVAAAFFGVLLWGIAWVAVWLTSSPYPRLSTIIFDALGNDIGQAIRITLDNATQNLSLMWQGAAHEIAQRQEVVALIVVLLGVLLLKARRFVKQFSYTEICLHLYNLGSILALNILFYDVHSFRDFRLIAPHVLFSVAMLAAFRRRVLLAGVIVVGVLVLPAAWVEYTNWTNFDFSPGTQAFYLEVQPRLATIAPYQPDASNAWCNSMLHTVNMLFARETIPILLGFDPGIGISFFQQPNELTLPFKSRYLLLDDAFVQSMPPDQLHIEKIADVPGGKIYLNLDTVCETGSSPTDAGG